MTDKTASRFLAWWQFIMPAMCVLLLLAGLIGQICAGVINWLGGIFFTSCLVITGYLSRRAYKELRQEYR